MDWLWIAVGMVAGGVAQALLMRWTGLAGAPVRRAKPVEERTPEELVRMVKQALADVDDVLERERRMYDRLRKRAHVDGEDSSRAPREDVPNGLAFGGADKDRLRALARQRGML